MKLSKEEQSFIDTIKHTWRENIPSQKEIDYLLDVLNKLVTPKPERFTYEMRSCVNCAGTGRATNNISALMRGDIRCKECAGMGQVRVKVKRTAHSV